MQNITKERIEALAKMAVDLDRYEFSEIPVGIRKEKTAVQFVRNEIVHVIGEAEYSKAWWIHEIGKTEEEWSAWYYSPERIYEEWEKDKAEKQKRHEQWERSYRSYKIKIRAKCVIYLIICCLLCLSAGCVVSYILKNM